MSLRCVDPLSLIDLRVFLERAERCGATSARFRAVGTVLACTVPVLLPSSLLDSSPTVLGMRTSAIEPEPEPDSETDRVVAIRGILERIARLGPGEQTIEWPPAQLSEAWAGVSAPRGGWSRIGELTGARLRDAARDGVAAVAAALPEQPGEAVLQQVRSRIWSAPLEQSQLPLGAAFAADALGFIEDDAAMTVLRSGSWLRLSSARGHVLVRGVLGATTE